MRSHYRVNLHARRTSEVSSSDLSQSLGQLIDKNGNLAIVQLATLQNGSTDRNQLGRRSAVTQPYCAIDANGDFKSKVTSKCKQDSAVWSQ